MEFEYCIFYKNDRLQFGWIREIRKNKAVVVPVQGKEFNSSTSRLEYIWPGKVIPEEKEALTYLGKKSSVTMDSLDDIELGVIHELCEPGTPYTLEELAENFLDDPEDGWSRVALLIKIKQDRTLFQQKKTQFIARSSEEIQKQIDEAEKKAENERRLNMEAEWADLLKHDQLPTFSDNDTEHWNQFLHRIAGFLRYFDSSQEKDYFRKLFHLQGAEQVVVERRMLKILSLAGRNMSWGYLLLSRTGAYDPVETAEINAISALNNRDLQGGVFALDTEDDCSLVTFTVDNAETRDYDDAVSLEILEKGAVLRVHIADVASYITRDDVLFRIGENRISSLYTVKETYPMFHLTLSENVFSLREGVERPVMTFEAQVDEDWEIVNSRIYRSIINVDRNLTYEGVDVAIKQEDPYWISVQRFCSRLKEKRIENGSLELERIEVKMDISDPDNIQIKEVRENTTAGFIIEELAIFANHMAASFCKEHDLLCLYRNQPPYSINRELEPGEKPTLGDIHIQPARIGIIPEGHSALGLDCYMQVTSPIRRFLDLINQGTIFSRLAEIEIGYSTDDMLHWARVGEDVQREYAGIERRLLDHWKIKYLYQHQEDVYDAQLVRLLRNGKALIRITGLQLVVESIMDETPSEEFQVVIDQVVPEYDRVITRLLRVPMDKINSNENESSPGDNESATDTLDTSGEL